MPLLFLERKSSQKELCRVWQCLLDQSFPLGNDSAVEIAEQFETARYRGFGGCPSAPTGAYVPHKYPGDRGTEPGWPWR